MVYNEKDFYNPQQKIRFLNLKNESMQPESVAAYDLRFRLFKEDEEQYGTDMCNFSYDIWMTILPLRLSRGRNSKGTQLSLIRDYVTWCISEGLSQSNYNAILDIKSSDIDSSIQIRKQFIKDPEHLESILNEILETDKDDSVQGFMYRMNCWLIYYGFTADEAIELRESNVDFDNNIISYNGKTIIMDERLRDLIKQAIEADSTIRNGREGIRQYDLEDTDRLFKKIKMKSTVHSSTALRTRLSYFRKQYEKSTYESVSLSTSRLWLSGIFYRLYLKEKAGHTLGDNDFKYNLSEGMIALSIQIKTKRNEQEYEDWKKAFDLKV